MLLDEEGRGGAELVQRHELRPKPLARPDAFSKLQAELRGALRALAPGRLDTPRRKRLGATQRLRGTGRAACSQHLQQGDTSLDSGASGGESSGAGRTKHITNVVERVAYGRQEAELVWRAQGTASASACIADLRGKSAKNSMTLSGHGGK